MTALRIKLLGTFQVALDERPVSAFRSDKTRALLAYLAVEADRPHRREALVDLLWPGQSRVDGLTSLRQAVWRLHHCLGDDGPGGGFLMCGRHEVRVNPVSAFWLDVAELRARSDACLAHHRAGELPCDDCLASLTAVVALYRGRFLPGLSPCIGVEFDDWLVTTQEEMHWRVLEVLDLLGRGLEARDDYVHAELFALRELELEPVRESAYRRLMRALALSGQRGPALQEYAHCQQLLLERLGVEPAPETTELRQRIAAGQLAPSPEPERADDYYRFRHALLRQYFYDRLDPAERAYLHAATGLVLEDHGEPACGGPAPVGQPVQLAWHAERAARYCLLAGAEAYQAAAIPEAIACFERGLRLIEPVTASVERDALEMALRMALAPLLRVTLGP